MASRQMTGNVDWVGLRDALDLPADAKRTEIYAALRALGLLPPVDSKPCAETTGEKPRGYLDAVRAAAKRGVDLHKINPTGAGGRITVADVERFATRWDPKLGEVYLDSLAAELEVDLDQVAGSGPGGKLTPGTWWPPHG